MHLGGSRSSEGEEGAEEEAELALTTSFLRRTVSVVGVRAQARLLLGRLEVIGPRATAAAGRRNYALNLERIWANQRRADALSRLQGKALLRRGISRQINPINTKVQNRLPTIMDANEKTRIFLFSYTFDFPLCIMCICEYFVLIPQYVSSVYKATQ